MRRLLAWAVALEMVLGGLALAAFAGGAPGDFGSSGQPSGAALTRARGGVVAGGSEAGRPEEAGGGGANGGGAGVVGRRRDATATSPGARTTSSADVPASGDAAGRPGPASKGVSFRSPVDFATGAAPPSTGFNKASGEQVFLQLRHLSLSDSVVTGDFNGDGHADVVQTNVLAGSLSIFLGDGRGGFATPAIHPVGVNPNFAVAGDLDGDRNLDLVVADTGANGVFILRGDGKGGFVPLGFLAVRSPRNVAIGRIDGDGIPDLAVAAAGPVCPRNEKKECANDPSDGGVHTFVGLGAGVFRPGQFIELTHSTDSRRVGANFVALDDFNGDGLGDLAVTVGTSTSAFDRAEATKPTGDDLLVFLNRGGLPEPFGGSPDQPAIRVGATPDAIALGDWNGDTHPDLAVLENASGSITTLVGDERGHFSVKATNRTVGALPRSLTVGDFDGDGVPDLVTASFAASTASVLEGNGDGTFQPAVDHWAGNAPTSAAVGDFDGDRRLDIVVARLRTDQLSLLTNDGAKRGDGVVIQRDISYGSPTDPDDDPFPTKHTLDVYVPPKGTAPFGGSGAYPVVFFAHGGGGIANNKSYNSYLLRSLSAQGIVAVSTNYRLGLGLAAEQVQDVAQAFRWTRDNIGSAPYGGDPDNMVAFGYSAGAMLLNKLATDPEWVEEQKNIRALVLAGTDQKAPGAAARIPESLLLSGDEGFEAIFRFREACDAYAAESNRRGTKSTHVNVSGRDHFTLAANLALPTDPGRIAIDAFLREQMDP